MNWLLSALLVVVAEAYPSFRDKIPNGNNVQHPCQPNVLWEGVGHLRKQGGGDRNPFGLDFDANGKVWNTNLCQMDSDGDGMTNGEELGDPNCVWTVGAAPQRLIDITHPGICGPFNDPNCAANHLLFEISCTPEKLNCSVLEEQDTFNITYRFPPTPVPVKETTYTCMVFDFPQSTDYHMVAYEPLIDNANVMHHIVVFGCRPDQTVPPSDVGVVHECGMGPSDSCNIILGIWSLGLSGHCLHENAGVRVGPNMYRQGALQFHWTNPFLETSYVDSSGMNLYFTPVLRTYDAGIFITGQNSLFIPPGLIRHEEIGVCPSNCTQEYITAPIQVFSALNHMHYLGSEMKVELFRNDMKITDLTNDPLYVYDSPFLHEYDNPIEVQPGDEIVTKCVYKSTSRSGTARYGDSTFDEMCFGLLYYYPAANTNRWTCISFKSISECDQSDGEVNGCRVWDFHNFGIPESQTRYNTVMNSCEPFGSCTYDCLEAQMSLRQDPCLLGDVYDLILNKEGTYDAQRILYHNALDTCDFCFRYYDLSIDENKQFYDSVVQSCEIFGTGLQERCLPQCQEALSNLQYHPCMRDETYEHFRSYAMNQNDADWLKFHSAVRSCRYNTP